MCMGIMLLLLCTTPLGLAGWPGLAAFFDAHLSEFISFAAHGRLARIKFDDYYDDISGSTNATTPIPNYEADDDG